VVGGVSRRAVRVAIAPPIDHQPPDHPSEKSTMSFYARQANNAFGVFLVCALFLVLTFAIDHANPSEHTGTVQVLISAIGVLALAANMFCRIKAVNWSKY
jgi:uncharacterized membrane protein YbhN (UPF0104 family)